MSGQNTTPQRWLQWGVAFITLFFLVGQATALSETTRKPGFGYCVHKYSLTATTNPVLSASWTLKDIQRPDTNTSFFASFKVDAYAHTLATGVTWPTTATCSFSKLHNGTELSGYISSDFVETTDDGSRVITVDLREANVDFNQPDFSTMDDYNTVIACDFELTGPVSTQKTTNQAFSDAYINFPINATTTALEMQNIDSSNWRQCHLEVPARPNRGYGVKAKYYNDDIDAAADSTSTKYEFIIRDVELTAAYKLSISTIKVDHASASATLFDKDHPTVGDTTTDSCSVEATLIFGSDTPIVVDINSLTHSYSVTATIVDYVLITVECDKSNIDDARHGTTTPTTFNMAITVDTADTNNPTTTYNAQIKPTHYMGLERIFNPTYFVCADAPEKCMSWNTGAHSEDDDNHIIVNEAIRVEFDQFSQQAFYLRGAGLNDVGDDIRVNAEVTIQAAGISRVECRLGHNQYAVRALVGSADTSTANQYVVSAKNLEIYQFGGLAPLFVQCVVHFATTVVAPKISVKMWTATVYDESLAPVLPLVLASNDVNDFTIKEFVYVTPKDPFLENKPAINALQIVKCAAGETGTPLTVSNNAIGILDECRAPRIVSYAQLTAPLTKVTLASQSFSVTVAPDICTSGVVFIHVSCDIDNDALAPAATQGVFAATEYVLDTRPTIYAADLTVAYPVIVHSASKAPTTTTIVDVEYGDLGAGKFPAEAMIDGAATVIATPLGEDLADISAPKVAMRPTFQYTGSKSGFVGMMEYNLDITGPFPCIYDLPISSVTILGVFSAASYFIGAEQHCGSLYPVYTHSSFDQPTFWVWDAMFDLSTSPSKVAFTLPYFFEQSTSGTNFKQDFSGEFDCTMKQPNATTGVWEVSTAVLTASASAYSPIKTFLVNFDGSGTFPSRFSVVCTLRNGVIAYSHVQSVVSQWTVSFIDDAPYVANPAFEINKNKFTARPYFEGESLPGEFAFVLATTDSRAKNDIQCLDEVATQVVSSGMAIYNYNFGMSPTGIITCGEPGYPIIAGFLNDPAESTFCADTYATAYLDTTYPVDDIKYNATEKSRTFVCDSNMALGFNSVFSPDYVQYCKPPSYDSNGDIVPGGWYSSADFYSAISEDAQCLTLAVVGSTVVLDRVAWYLGGIVYSDRDISSTVFTFSVNYTYELVLKMTFSNTVLDHDDIQFTITHSADVTTNNCQATSSGFFEDEIGDTLVAKISLNCANADQPYIDFKVGTVGVPAAHFFGKVKSFYGQPFEVADAATCIEGDVEAFYDPEAYKAMVNDRTTSSTIVPTEVFMVADETDSRYFCAGKFSDYTIPTSGFFAIGTVPTAFTAGTNAITISLATTNEGGTTAVIGGITYKATPVSGQQYLPSAYLCLNLVAVGPIKGTPALYVGSTSVVNSTTDSEFLDVFYNTVATVIECPDHHFAYQTYDQICDIKTGLWMVDYVRCVPMKCETALPSPPINAEWDMLTNDTASTVPSITYNEVGDAFRAVCPAGYKAPDTAAYGVFCAATKTVSGGVDVFDYEWRTVGTLFECEAVKCDPEVVSNLLHLNASYFVYDAASNYTYLHSNPIVAFANATEGDKVTVSCATNAGLYSNFGSATSYTCTNGAWVSSGAVAFPDTECYDARCPITILPNYNQANVAFAEKYYNRTDLVDNVGINCCSTNATSCADFKVYSDYSCGIDNLGLPKWHGSYFYCASSKDQCDGALPTIAHSEPGLEGLYHATPATPTVDAHTKNGDSLRVTCKPGYSVNHAALTGAALQCTHTVGSGFGFKTILASGFTATNPLCIRTSCVLPSIPTGVELTVNRFFMDGAFYALDGTFAHYTCPGTQTLVGPTSSKCVNGVWNNGAAPRVSCVELGCSVNDDNIDYKDYSGVALDSADAQPGDTAFASCNHTYARFETPLYATSEGGDFDATQVRAVRLPVVCVFNAATGTSVWKTYVADGTQADVPMCSVSFCELTQAAASLARWQGSVIMTSNIHGFNYFTNVAGPIKASPGDELHYTCPENIGTPSSIDFTTLCVGQKSLGLAATVTSATDFYGWETMPVCTYTDCNNQYFSDPNVDNGSSQTNLGNAFEVECKEGYIPAGVAPRCSAAGWDVPATATLCKVDVKCDALDSGLYNMERIDAVAGLTDYSVGTTHSVKCVDSDMEIPATSSFIIKCVADTATKGKFTAYPATLAMPVCAVPACTPNTGVEIVSNNLKCVNISHALVYMPTMTLMVDGDPKLATTCTDGTMADYRCFNRDDKCKEENLPDAPVFGEYFLDTDHGIDYQMICKDPTAIPVNMPIYKCVQRFESTGEFVSVFELTTSYNADPNCYYSTGTCETFALKEDTINNLSDPMIVNDVDLNGKTVSCPAGYYPVSRDELSFTCVNGRWLQSSSNALASAVTASSLCKPIPCPEHPIGTSGLNILDRSANHESYRVQCTNLDYTMYDTTGIVNASITTITCDVATGYWQSMPTCARICDAALTVDNGNVHFSKAVFPGNFVAAGTDVFLQCKPGYHAAEQELSTCKNTGGAWVSKDNSAIPSKLACEFDVEFTDNKVFRMTDAMTFEIKMKNVGTTTAFMTPSNENCYAFFEDVTADSFGSAAICALHVEGIRVRVSDDFTLLKNSPVYIRGDVIFSSLVADGATSGPFLPRTEMISIDVDTNKLMLTSTTSQVTYGIFADSCTDTVDIDFLAYFTTASHYAGRNLKISASTTTPNTLSNAAVANINAMLGEYNNNGWIESRQAVHNGLSHKAIFGPNMVYAATSVNIKLTATNWLGYSADYQLLFSLSTNGNIVPKLQNDGVEVYVGEQFKVAAFNPAVNCLANTKITSFVWTYANQVVSSTTATFTAVSSSTTATYVLYYTVDGFPRSASQTFDVVIKPIVLHPIIAGPVYTQHRPASDPSANIDAAGAFSHNVFDRTASLVIDGSMSHAEGAYSSALKYQWKCMMDIYYDATISQGTSMEESVPVADVSSTNRNVWVDCSVRAYGRKFTQYGSKLTLSNEDLAALFVGQGELRIRYDLTVSSDIDDVNPATVSTMVRLIDSEAHHVVSYVTVAIPDSQLASFGADTIRYSYRRQRPQRYTVLPGQDLTLRGVISAPSSTYTSFWSCSGIDLAQFALSPTTNAATLTISGAAFVGGFDAECRISVLAGNVGIPSDTSVVAYNGRDAHYAYMRIVVHTPPYVTMSVAVEPTVTTVTANSVSVTNADMLYSFFLIRGSSRIAVSLNQTQKALKYFTSPASNTFEIEVVDSYGAMTLASKTAAVPSGTSTNGNSQQSAQAALTAASPSDYIMQALSAAANLLGNNTDAANAIRVELIKYATEKLSSFAGLEGSNAAGSTGVLEAVATLVGSGSNTTQPSVEVRSAALAAVSAHIEALATSGSKATPNTAKIAVETFAKVAEVAAVEKNVTEITLAARSFAAQLPFIVYNLLGASTAESGSVSLTSGKVTVTAQRFTLAAAQAAFAQAGRTVRVSSDFFQSLAAQGLTTVDAAEITHDDAAFTSSVGAATEESAVSRVVGLAFFTGYTAVDTSSISRVLLTAAHPNGLTSSAHRYRTCQFLDESSYALDSERAAWGTGGCVVDSQEETYTVCRCTHLTSFRVRAGYDLYAGDGWLQLTNHNLDNNRNPIYMILVWFGAAIVLVIIAASVDGSKKVQGLKMLVGQWATGEAPKRGDAIEGAHCSNAVLMTKSMLCENHLFFSAFARSPLSNIGGATRMLASSIVLLSAFAVTVMFWGGSQARNDIDNFGGVMFLGALVMIGVSIILHFVLSHTRSYGVKDFLYQYAFEAAQLFHTGSSDYFTTAEANALKARADPAHAALYAQAMNAAVVGNEAELHTLLRQCIVIDEAAATATFNRKGVSIGAGAIFSYGFLVAWVFGLSILICAFGIQLENTVSTTFGTWIGSAFATIGVEMFAVKPFLFFMYSLLATTCSANPASAGAYEQDAVLTAYEKLRAYAPPTAAHGEDTADGAVAVEEDGATI